MDGGVSNGLSGSFCSRGCGNGRRPSSDKSRPVRRDLLVSARNTAMAVLWISVGVLIVVGWIDEGIEPVLTTTKWIMPVITASSGLAVYIVT